MTAIVSTMRSYDVTVRWGDDEFVCALSEVTLELASERVAGIEGGLAALQPDASISTGLTLLADGDDVDSVIARADAARYSATRRRRHGGQIASPRSTGGSRYASAPGVGTRLWAEIPLSHE